MKYKAITLIELLLVISLVTVLAASTAPFASSFILRNNLSTNTNKTISAIYKTQNNAMNQKLYEYWGICNDGTNIVVFGGDIDATCSSNSFSETFSISSTVTITGVSETMFNKLGEPVPSNGLETITISTELDSNVINVNPMGGIEKN